MSYLACRGCPPRQLGFLPTEGMLTGGSTALSLNDVGQVASPSSVISSAASLLSIATNPIGAIMAGLNPVLSVLGLNSSDPVKDQQRINRINDTYRAAATGQKTPEGIDGVQCLREMAQGVSSGPNDPRACAVGSQVAATYAKKMWAEFQARQAAGTLGVALIGASNIPTTVGAAVAAAATSPVTWLLVGGAAWLLLRKRGR